MYICIDFDGTVVDHRYPYVGDPAPLAVDWLQRFVELGAKLILFTMRSDDAEGKEYLRDAVQYFEKNDIALFGINHNPDQDSWTKSPKAYGELYIDDSAFGCPLIHPPTFNRPCVDWKLVGPAVEAQLLKQ
ncbi:MAG TPA: hypothetical protein EYH36_04200 [Desulfocapsa sulfexigens]|nr:hypothetical protein [Desulfocapsa sulfexigens]